MARKAKNAEVEELQLNEETVETVENTKEEAEVEAVEIVEQESITPSEDSIIDEVVTPAGEHILVNSKTGLPISRSAYIRQEFMKDRSRGDIAKELNVAYGIVYSATANMTNAVHAGVDEGGTARGVIMTHPETGAQISRADYCREQLLKGRSRAELSKELNVAYATIYAATKDITPVGGGQFGGSRVHIEIDGQSKPRAEFIRQMYAEGKSRREIANEIGCDYAIVWAATKKTEQVTLPEFAPTPEEEGMVDPEEQDYNEDNEETEQE